MRSLTSGGHCRLVDETDPARKVTVPVHSGDLKRGTLRAIVAQAGLTVAEFLAFLRWRIGIASMSSRTVRYTAGEISRVRLIEDPSALARRSRAAQGQREGDALICRGAASISSSGKPRSAARHISA